MNNIVVPFKPRPYQKNLISYVLNGGKRAIALWHRRAGKDLCLFNLMIRLATQRSGIYYYFLPTYSQGKKIIWEGRTNDGMKFIDYIPKEIIKKTDSQEMKIILINNSLIQVIGTDNFDSIRGTNPVGCVFSEYAYQDPRAFDVVSPILRANGGWAIFNTTPNGKNHAYTLYNMALNNKDWFAEKLTWKDTKVLTEADIQAERDAGRPEEMIEQEYNCSFDIGAVGSYYVKHIQKMVEEDRICHVPYDASKLVNVYTDIGKSDSTVFVFVQSHGKEIHIIDHYAASGKDVEDYVLVLRGRGYHYENLYLPHDANQSRIGMKYNVREQFEQAGFHVKMVKSISKQDGIQVVRARFKNFWIDKSKNENLILALESYRKEYDAVKKVFSDVPEHDWSSDYADAIRYMAIAHVNPNDKTERHNIENPVLKKKNLLGFKLPDIRTKMPWMK